MTNVATLVMSGRLVTSERPEMLKSELNRQIFGLCDLEI